MYLDLEMLFQMGLLRIHSSSLIRLGVGLYIYFTSKYVNQVFTIYK